MDWPDIETPTLTRTGQIVVLNGVPRSGKSSIAAALAAAAPDQWTSVGVDSMRSATPKELLPGVGLRPGGERPDIEAHLMELYGRMYSQVQDAADSGLNVAVDVGHHEGHSRPVGVLDAIAESMAERRALFVGVRCSVEEILRRRDVSSDSVVSYAGSNPDGSAPEPVLLWERFVHEPGVYDMEVDTSVTTAAECAGAIIERLATGRPPTAFRQLASR